MTIVANGIFNKETVFSVVITDYLTPNGVS